MCFGMNCPYEQLDGECSLSWYFPPGWVCPPDEEDDDDLEEDEEENEE